MNTSVNFKAINGKICAGTSTSERHESQCEVKGLKISIPTPAGVVSVEVAEYSSGSFDKEGGGSHYCQDGSPVFKAEPKEPSDAKVNAGYAFATTLMATTLGQINAIEAAAQERRKEDQAHERAMADMKHRHSLEMMELMDKLEGDKHARIQASKHAS